MNSSGKSVALAVDTLQVKPEDILLIHDDIAFDFGNLKIKSSGSGGNHNGVKSVIDCLGFNNFNRLRIGIGTPNEEQTLYDYVLSDFAANESKYFCELYAVVIEIADGFIEHGAQWAMSTFNRRK
jgi:PTH1 family peptidyl-tRNA hydrolase